MANKDIAKIIANLKKDQNNAVAHIFSAITAQKGSLKDKVITLKDIFATKNAPTQASSKILENFKPNYDATVVGKIKNAGGLIVAKVHSDELALGGTGQFSAYGVVRHPQDKLRIIGGSSSGSAATMHLGIDIGLASDTGDSVRLPASYNGLVGFKPSYGAVSRYGMFPYASSLDTVAWFTHNVNDVICLANVLYGQDEKDLTSLDIKLNTIIAKKPQRIAYLEITKTDVKAYVWTSYINLIKTLKAENIELIPIKIDQNLLDAVGIIYEIISFSEASSNIANLSAIGFGNRQAGADWKEIMINSRTKGFSDMVKRRMTLGAFYLEQENQHQYFLKSQKVRRIINNLFIDIFRKNDILIYPSTPEIAPLSATGKMKTYMSNILINANLLGNPSLTLKWQKHQGLPYGIQLDGKSQEDATLLAHGLWFENFLGVDHD